MKYEKPTMKVRFKPPANMNHPLLYINNILAEFTIPYVGKFILGVKTQKYYKGKVGEPYINVELYATYSGKYRHLKTIRIVGSEVDALIDNYNLDDDYLYTIFNKSPTRGEHARGEQNITLTHNAEMVLYFESANDIHTLQNKFLNYTVPTNMTRSQIPLQKNGMLTYLQTSGVVRHFQGAKEALKSTELFYNFLSDEYYAHTVGIKKFGPWFFGKRHHDKMLSYAKTSFYGKAPADSDTLNYFTHTLARLCRDSEIALHDKRYKRVEKMQKVLFD